MESAKAAPGEKPKLEIHVCYCAQKDYDDSLRHWMLMLNNPEAVKGDWMGGPNGKQIPAPFFFIVLLYTYMILKSMFQEPETNPDTYSPDACDAIHSPNLHSSSASKE